MFISTWFMPERVSLDTEASFNYTIPESARDKIRTISLVLCQTSAEAAETVDSENSWSIVQIRGKFYLVNVKVPVLMFYRL